MVCLNLNIDFSEVFVFISLLLILYMLGTILLGPLKKFFKIIVFGVFGCIALLVINFFGQIFAFHIPINPISAIAVGFLGLPGLVLISVLNLIV